MSEKRWLKRAKLLLLSLVGICVVSVPVTAAVVLSAAGAESPLVLGAPTDARPARENPAEAITASLKCSPTRGYYAITFDDGPFTRTAHPNAFVRPPYGETSADTEADMRKTGLVPVYWTTDTFDWQRPAVEIIVRRALQVQPEGIILLHDGHENTVRAVPRIVSELQADGMCPGLLAGTDKTVVSSYRDTQFNVIAVSPHNDSGVAIGS